MNNTDKLLEVMSQLRDKENGCEWDKEQTFKSIAPHTIEEAYEVVDAINRSNIPDLEEELGDLLLQVVFLSQIASEDNLFNFNDVVQTITRKLIRRHPYVFSEKRDHSSEEQMDQWEEIKQEERELKKQSGILDGIAINLPALKRSQKIQKRAAKVGFDWPDSKGVFKKIKEEIRELEEAVESKDQESTKEEVGDLLMIITNLAHRLDVDSEEALKGSNEKFINRFSYIESKLNDSDKRFEDSSLALLDELWDESKKLG
ncbi:nucleoside triphosphate pyrophosphohydrolase [Gammaproteobacteria bacterium]|nr:nucleoside triphosphate pyrophosphohydrolase [Gammaproteobacteria bacterium]